MLEYNVIVKLLCRFFDNEHISVRLIFNVFDFINRHFSDKIPLKMYVCMFFKLKKLSFCFYSMFLNKIVVPAIMFAKN